jgi:hypothetical protein
VYAIGIDGRSEPTLGPGGPPRVPLPLPWPFPIPGRRQWPLPQPQPPAPRGGGGSWQPDGVNAAALREITNDSGGRTELVRSSRDLEPATASIADELSKQYYLGYAAASEKDGRWHSIRVEVRDPTLRVRARRGYVATP